MEKMIVGLVMLLFNIQIFAQEPIASIGSMCPKIEYPSASKRLEEEGTVRLKFLIDIDGKVLESEIEKSSGFLRLDEAARTGLSKCQFKPSTVLGVPQKSWTKMNFTFRLEESLKTSPPSIYVINDFYIKNLIKEKNYQKLKFSEFKNINYLNLNCRLTTKPIFYTNDSQKIEKFIQNAFNAELKNANIYSEDDVEIKAEIKNLQVATYLSGNWTIEIEFYVLDKGAVKINDKFEFPYSPSAETACPKAAEAFPLAIKKFIYKTFSDNEFYELTSKTR